MKLPAHRAGLPGHASGEQNVSKGNFVHIVPLDPAYEAGIAEHVPAKLQCLTLDHHSVLLKRGVTYNIDDPQS